MHCMCCLLGDNLLRVSHISTCLMSRSMENFCSGLTFQRCFYSEQSWRIEIVSPSGAEADLLSVQDNKDNVFL